MKVIAVTGSPGTGKTAMAKKLAKRLDFYYLDVNKLVSKNKLSEGYDRKRKTKIVDIKKLSKALVNFIEEFKKSDGMRLMSSASSTKALTKENINKIALNKKSNKNSSKTIKKYSGIVIDSHLSHYLPGKYVDLCIVTKCNIKELNKRLKKRKYPKSKIQENIQAEIFDICLNEAKEGKHNLVIVDTTKDFNIAKISKQIGETDAV